VTDRLVGAKRRLLGGSVRRSEGHRQIIGSSKPLKASFLVIRPRLKDARLTLSLATEKNADEPTDRLALKKDHAFAHGNVAKLRVVRV